MGLSCFMAYGTFIYNRGVAYLDTSAIRKRGAFIYFFKKGALILCGGGFNERNFTERNVHFLKIPMSLNVIDGLSTNDSGWAISS